MSSIPPPSLPPLLQYEPELFPGLIYRMQQPKVVLLIFVSGKVVLTGAKRREDLIAAFELIYPVLKEFKKGGALPGLCDGWGCVLRAVARGRGAVAHRKPVLCSWGWGGAGVWCPS